MSKSKTPMTPAAAARIHRAEAKREGGCVSKDSFTARAQRTVAGQATESGKK